MKKTILSATLAISLLILFTGFSSLAVPKYINYQGKLTDKEGNALDGAYQMKFSIYDTEASGEQALWDEEQVVIVTDGIYNIQLGDVNNPLSIDLFNNDDLYLEVAVNGETLSPRYHLASAPFAMKAGDAETLEGIAASDVVTSAELKAHAGKEDAHHSKTASFKELTDMATDDQIPNNITISGVVNTPMKEDFDGGGFNIYNIKELKATNVVGKDIITEGPWVDVRAYGAKFDGSIDDAPAINDAITAIYNAGGGTLLLPSGMAILAGPILRKDKVNIIGQGRSTHLQVAGSGWSGDAVIKSADRDNNNPNTWVAASLQNFRITIPITPTSLLSGIDMTGTRHNLVQHIWINGAGESATNIVGIMLSDENPTDTSHKSCFFNVLQNIDCTGAGMGTALKYRQKHGDCNSNRINGFDASCNIGLDLTDTAGYSSAMSFQNMYLATVTGGSNHVVQNSVFPGEAIFENIVGEGFDPSDNWIKLKVTSSYPTGGIPVEFSRIKIAGYASSSFEGRLEAIHSIESANSAGRPFGLVSEQIVPTYEAISNPWGGSGRYSNLLLHSEDFGTTWTPVNITVTTDSTTAPSGTATADKIQVTISGGNYINQVITTSQVQDRDFTFSIWAKKGTTPHLHLMINSGGQVSVITAYLTDDWNRYRLTHTPTITGTQVECRMWMDATEGNNCYVWGAQLEEDAADMGAYVETVASNVSTVRRGVVLSDYMTLSPNNGNVGTFSFPAAASATVNNSSVTANSIIVVFPTNVSAAQLVSGERSPYISAKTAGTSFTVSTASGGNATGTETFNYIIFN